MAKSILSVVIPAYNEEKVIESSLKALKKVINKKNIYVVSDGSTDKTAKLAKSQSVNVMNLRKNGGKSTALHKLIVSRKLTKRYKYILFSDADSRLSTNFAKEIKKYISINPALIVGTVSSDKKGLISAFRTYEYGLSHRVYKRAQDIIHTVAVAPGCASLYRSDVIEKLNFKNRTLTEDFDLTIQIHKNNLGLITYAPKATVVTQDPLTLIDYWKQITRWNTGTWQNIFLHKLYKPNTKLNIELYFLLLDNVLWIVSFGLLFLHPILFIRLFLIMCLSLMVFALTISIIEKKFWVIVYIPFFPLFYIINIISYYYSIYRAIKGRNQVLAWNKVARYSN